jgi:hypothetical protein
MSSETLYEITFHYEEDSIPHTATYTFISSDLVKTKKEATELFKRTHPNAKNVSTSRKFTIGKAKKER